MAQLQHIQLLQPVQMQHRGVIAPLQEDTVLPSVAVALGILKSGSSDRNTRHFGR